MEKTFWGKKKQVPKYYVQDDPIWIEKKKKELYWDIIHITIKFTLIRCTIFYTKKKNQFQVSLHKHHMLFFKASQLEKWGN